jgi:hypothetical protein
MLAPTRRFAARSTAHEKGARRILHPGRAPQPDGVIRLHRDLRVAPTKRSPPQTFVTECRAHGTADARKYRVHHSRARSWRRLRLRTARLSARRIKPCGIDCRRHEAWWGRTIEQEKLASFEALSSYAANAHSGVFAEAKVDQQLGVIRVTRVISAPRRRTHPQHQDRVV